MEQLITKSLIKRGWLRATIGLVFIKGVLGNIIMKTKLTIKLIIICALSYIGCNEQYEKNNINEFPVLNGPYLGQKPPGMVPEIFAPGIVSDGLDNRDIAIMPDGSEIYFTSSVGGTEYVTILYSRLSDGIWSKPEVVSFATNPKFMFYEPCISSDGNRIFFTSNMPIKKGIAKSEPNIWYVERDGDHWGNPIALDTTVNSSFDEYFSSITQDGTLYFTRGSGSGVYSIYRSKLVNGKYSEGEKLPKEVNCGTTQFNSFIARDESYIILSIYGLAETIGGIDYYIIYRNEDDTWGKPINLSDKINTEGNDEYSPYISPDGKYFFFMSKRSLTDELIPDKLSFDFLHEINDKPNNGNSDIYWVEAKTITNLKPTK